MIALCALFLATAVAPTPLPTPVTTAPATAPGVTPAPAPPPVTPAPTAVPTGVPTPIATGAPTPVASPTPYHYRFVPHQPAHVAPGDPQIYAVYLNDKQLRSLGPIDIRVETNPDVVKVVSRSNGRDGIVPLIAPGLFIAEGRLPKIPFIAAGMSVDLQFIGTTADGRKVIVTVPVRLN